VNRKYALTWDDVFKVMRPYGDAAAPLWVCSLCGFVVNSKMLRLHVIERHPVVPVDVGFKCVKCGRIEDSARDLMENCDHKDKCYIRWFKRKLAGIDEAELLRTEVKLKLRALKQALEEGNTEEATRIADQLLELTGARGG
jgi:hypothetical protein